MLCSLLLLSAGWQIVGTANIEQLSVIPHYIMQGRGVSIVHIYVSYVVT
jgi:hypothetical protein